MTKKFWFALALSFVAAVWLGSTTGKAAEEGEGKEISVPADKPVWKMTLPEGWTCTEPVTLDSNLGWSGDLFLTGQFSKLGEFADAGAAKKKAQGEAQMFLSMGGEDKNPPAPDATEKEIAGHKGFEIEKKYTSGTKAKLLHVAAFSTDGKTYYLLIVQCPEATMPTEAVASMIDSIAAAK